MRPEHDTRNEPAIPPQEPLADILGCAALWVDLAAMSMSLREDPGRAADALTHARRQLRDAIRHLRGPQAPC